VATLKREIGNMILSSVRWASDLGLDPNSCIDAALRRRRIRAEAGGRNVSLLDFFTGHWTASQLFWELFPLRLSAHRRISSLST